MRVPVTGITGASGLCLLDLSQQPTGFRDHVLIATQPIPWSITHVLKTIEHVLRAIELVLRATEQLLCHIEFVIGIYNKFHGQ